MDEIIKAITQAEERAAQIKSDAVEQAARIIDEARSKSAEIGREAAQSRSAFRDDSLKAAEAKAEEDYKKAISDSRKAAEEYALRVGKHTDVAVGKIVGRVTSGNC